MLSGACKSRLMVAVTCILVILIVPCRGKEMLGTADMVKAFNVGAVTTVVCYSDLPALIFVRPSKDISTIVLMRLDGTEQELLRIDGILAASSLSCSDDGLTIAVLRENPPRSVDLFLFRSGRLSQYRLDRWPISPIRGKASLLSADAQSIALPARPILVSGPDVVAEMNLFVYADGNVFFVGSKLLHDRNATIEMFAKASAGWQLEASITKDRSKYINEVGHCFGHMLAVVADERTERNDLYDLSGGKLEKPDWVETVGFGNMIRSAGSIDAAISDFGRCALAITRPRANTDAGAPLRQFSIIDSNGLSAYRLVVKSAVTPSTHRIGLTKDGCHAIATAFVSAPQIPQFTLPQQVLLFKLSDNSGRCH